MKILSRSHYLHVPDIIEKMPCAQAIIIEVAQLPVIPIDRKTLRMAQSNAVRQLLTETLNQSYDKDQVASWSLARAKSGKPFLRGEQPPSISLTHSHDWVACAVVQSGLIGIDLELIKNRDWTAWGEHVFHAEELQWIMESIGRERDIRALTCWCRKESLTKAIGVGIDIHLSSIGFSRHGELIALPEVLGAISGWQSYGTTIDDNAVMVVSWRN